MNIGMVMVNSLRPLNGHPLAAKEHNVNMKITYVLSMIQHCRLSASWYHIVRARIFYLVMI